MGLKKGGYGLTYQEVYLMDNLTIEAKAIYGMLCSYAGNGATAYPSVDFICRNLHISNSRFYKHMNLLIGAGIVQKIQIKGENGSFANNIYTLVPNLQNVQNPCTGNECTGNECTGNLYTENLGTNNTKININSINNNNNIISSEPDKSAPNLSGILIQLNDKSFYDVPLEKIALWENTYPAVDVKQELRKMAAWCDSNPTRRKTKRGIERFINNWLSRTQDSGGTKGKEKVIDEERTNNTYNTDEEWERIKRIVNEAGKGNKQRNDIFT